MKVRLARASVILLLILSTGIRCYNHKPCNRAARAQFQLPDCYVPSLSSSLPLTSASFLMSHDAATGYIQPGKLSASGISWFYSKNQVGTVYKQLNDGARALDLRPKLLGNGTVIYQHGQINIPIGMDALVADAVRWCADNPDELVLLLASNFAYESSAAAYTNDGKPSIVASMESVFETYGIPHLHCTDVYGLTVGDAMELAALPTGGYLMAIDGQDYHGSFCGKTNWVESQLVTCWPASNATSCKTSTEPLAALQNYALSSANNDASDDQSVLGPPANLYYYPFNEIQALWQVDTHAAAVGVLHLSSILDDNRQSKVNEEMVRMVYKEGTFNSISLFVVDNVALNGNALLSVLRNSCGQSDSDVCGYEIDMPRMHYIHINPRRAILVLLGLYAAWLLVLAVRKKRFRMFLTFLTRMVQCKAGEESEESATQYELSS